jgi:ATP adenylyltransferase
VIGSRRDMVVCQGDHGVRFPDGEQLWKDITTRYDSAQGMKASSFTDTVTEVVEDGGFSYILKIACRLKDKPKAPKDRGAWKNPFLPPDEDLYVCQLSDTHSLVLNPSDCR